MSKNPPHVARLTFDGGSELDNGCDYVYIIQESGSPYIKIGFAEKPLVRMSDLQTGNPRKLVLLAIFVPHTSKSSEKEFHRRYRRWHVTGEWFLLSDILAARLATDGWMIWEPTPEYVMARTAYFAAMELSQRGVYERQPAGRQPYHLGRQAPVLR